MKSLSQIFFEDIIENFSGSLNKIFSQDDFTSICSQRYNGKISLLLFYGFLKKNPSFSKNYLFSSENGISSYPHLTLNFIEKHLDILWDWDYILFESSLVMDLIGKYSIPPPYLSSKFPVWDWSKEGLSQNPNLIMEFVEKHLDENWDWDRLSRQPNLTMEFLEKHLNKSWNWSTLSLHPNLTMEFIENHPNLPWSWYWLSSNLNLTMEFIEKHLDYPWNWEWLSGNSNLTIEFVEKHLNYPWNWGGKGLSKNPNLTMEFVKKRLDKSWNWNILSLNPSLTMEFVEEHLDYPWNWDWLSGNPNLTMEFIKKHLDKRWNWGWGGISQNPNISFEFLLGYTTDVKTWSLSPNLTMEFVEKHLEKNWDWKEISKNPNLTSDFVIKHTDKDWNWIKIFQRFKMCYINIFPIPKYKVEINRDILLSSEGRKGYSLSELRGFLRKLGLKVSGKKSELIQRLIMYSTAF